jgi:hypothetical protein
VSDNYTHIFEQIAHVAAPYVIYWQESRTRGGLIIELKDEDRGRPDKSKQILVKNEKIKATSNLSALFTRAVEALKKRFQEELAKECDEPELRLWIAQYRDTDLMNNEPIPLNLRKLYEAHLNPPVKRVVRTTEKKEAPVPVKSSRGVPVKEQKRKPHCPVHTETSMEYDPEKGKWKCPEPGCKIVAKPKDDSPVGKLIMARGQLDLRVVYPEDGGEPSIILISDNNVAMDITSLIDRENFLKYNDYVRAAEQAKRSGESVTYTTTRGSAVLKFPKPAKVYGCEHS